MTCWMGIWAFPVLGQGQEIGPDTTTISVYKRQVGQLVSFLQFSMNTIGSELTTPRERDIIISESYLKIFRDDKVQVEDDLAGTRSTVTNKDVQAYLKDIDFFFRDVRFELNVDEISHEVNEDGLLYF